jgi:tetratricopeptide (TPR) repeat protein
VLLTVEAGGERWRRTVDLRVDDHPDPLAEIRRLHRLHRAYELSEQAEALTGEGRHAEAAPLYERAAELAPDSDELLFFSGLAAAVAGDLDAALERVRSAMDVNPGWTELLPRLSPEIAPGAAEVLAALGRD